jgi:hypothetical protein
MAETDAYQSKLKKSSPGSGSFVFDSPYFIVRENSDKSEMPSAFFMEGISPDTFGELKTLIVPYMYPDFTESYINEATGEKVNITSYGVHIVYFDMIKNEIIGYDNVRGSSMPYHLKDDSNAIGSGRYFGVYTVENKVEERFNDSLLE